jgi:hypothetical protein
MHATIRPATTAEIRSGADEIIADDEYGTELEAYVADLVADVAAGDKGDEYPYTLQVGCRVDGGPGYGMMVTHYVVTVA